MKRILTIEIIPQQYDRLVLGLLVVGLEVAIVIAVVVGLH
jgi:hypothetical protein